MRKERDVYKRQAMDMTMKCPHSSIKNLPLCLTTHLKEQRKKGLNWKDVYKRQVQGIDLENNKAVLFELNIENDRCIFPNTRCV